MNISMPIRDSVGQGYKIMTRITGGGMNNSDRSFGLCQVVFFRTLLILYPVPARYL